MNDINTTNTPEFWFYKGNSATAHGNYAAAVHYFRHALSLAPESIETLLNLGFALDAQGCTTEAFQCYESVLEASPHNAKAHYNRAAHLLRSGDFINGFADYEYRFAAVQEADHRIYSQPRWRGEPIHGRTILVYCEQGLGDAIMFARFLPQLSALGARIILEVQQPLVSLLSRLDHIEIVVEKSNTPPRADYFIPLLSLPYVFRTAHDSIPVQVPYVLPPESLTTKWKARIDNRSDVMRVGIAWAGKMNPYPNRSCPHENLAPLFALLQCQFYSLQLGNQNLGPMSETISERLIDFTTLIHNFADTAALILNLDLVITIDSAVAHLAGALGKPVWVMLAHAADWRWMTERTDSPWYPSMRLFRQPETGDWKSVIANVVHALEIRTSEDTPISEIETDSDEALFQLALQTLAEGNHVVAIKYLSTLGAKLPDEPAIWFNLGHAHDASGMADKAAECYAKALKLKPDSPAILYCLGRLQLEQHAFPDAEACLRKAHLLMPHSIEILMELGAVLNQQNDLNGAFECCHKMLAINPDNVEATYNLAYLQLCTGDYRAGFSNFEIRLLKQNRKNSHRTYIQPHWDGSHLAGRSILVFGEQGMGDVIQFARYLPLIAERGGEITLEIDPPLIPLFATFPGLARVLPKSATPPLTDVYVNLLSLPHLFGTTLETVPNRIPYIFPDPKKAAIWRCTLADVPAFRIGLVWRGNPDNPMDRERSCSLRIFEPLKTLSGVTYFSLQVGAGAEEIPFATIEIIDYTARLNDMSDTAAFIANLDLIIGVDTAVTHLAGAMGKPVWIILPHTYDWRWLAGKEKSPWYPTAQIFWQKRHGDWESVIGRVTENLKQFLQCKVLSHEPEDIETIYLKGCQLKETGDLEGARHCFRKIIIIDENLPDPHHSLGVILQLQGNQKEAIVQYHAAIALDPHFVKAHYNLANALLLCGRYREAIAAAQSAINHDPMHADAHWLLGMLLLQSGNYSQGWAEYEWRWQAYNFKTTIPVFSCPCWDGMPLNGKSLLIHMEQGRGDMIQFIRYAPVIAAAGTNVFVLAAEELVSLISRMPGVKKAAASLDLLPVFDLHIPVMSIPFLQKTTLETIPDTVPYLMPDSRIIEKWHQAFHRSKRFRIGLAWQGSAIHRDDHNRSCPLKEFLALSTLAEIDFYSLQLGNGTDQLPYVQDRLTITDLSQQINDFSDTAAIIHNLDLVISVDTAVAHLAGALGKPVWTMLPFIADWRWLLETDNSPWYPSMRLFRQTSPGDWNSVIEQIHLELSLLLMGSDFLNRQGLDLMNSGCIGEAERVFATAIVNSPDNAEAYCNRGVALDALSRHGEAIECYRMALTFKPDYFQAMFNMGNACMSLSNNYGARACYESVLQLKSDFIPAHLCLGEIAKSLRDYSGAHNHFLKALLSDPSCQEAHQGIAETYQAEEAFEEAIISYKKVLAYTPNNSDAWNKLGTVYHSLEKLEDAEASYRQALKLQPDSVVILNNLGVELNDMGRLVEAISVYRQLLAIDDTYADGHWNLAMALLACGNLPEGWQEYEWRFRKTNPVRERNFLQPRWDGSPLSGKTILIYSEQGFGDTIQFARYAPIVAQHDGKIILECQSPALKRLLETVSGVDKVIVDGDTLPNFDCHIPLMSLPLLFETTLETIHDKVPYVTPDQSDVEFWHSLVKSDKGLRVGLAWHGRQGLVLNRKRSCPLRALLPLLTIPNITFYSLQIGEGSEQLDELYFKFAIRDLTTHINDFADTAAFMTNLDVVVTIDTAVAHLAGALGITTLCLLPFGADWRWLRTRQDSPWYPTMQLFRQPVRSEWCSVVMHVADELTKLSLHQR